MRPYKTKSGVLGYSIGLQNDDLYIAVPKKYFTDSCDSIDVIFDNKMKTFVVSQHEHETTFKDKYKPQNNYTIYYFKWTTYEK